jgi:hypothetical protein
VLCDVVDQLRKGSFGDGVKIEMIPTPAAKLRHWDSLIIEMVFLRQAHLAMWDQSGVRSFSDNVLIAR